MDNDSTVLIISEDQALTRRLAQRLESRNHAIQRSTSFDRALRLARSRRPGLILLDLELPDVDRYESLKALLRRQEAPIISLSGPSDPLDEIITLKLGVADHIPKPLNLDVVLARIDSALKHHRPPPAHAAVEPVNVGSLEIHPDEHILLNHGKPVELSPREFELLYLLAQEAGRPISTDELLATIWGAEYVGESQIIYVHICWLRQKIEDDPHDPKLIVTVHRVGYKLEAVESLG